MKKKKKKKEEEEEDGGKNVDGDIGQAYVPGSGPPSSPPRSRRTLGPRGSGRFLTKYSHRSSHVGSLVSVRRVAVRVEGVEKDGGVGWRRMGLARPRRCCLRRLEFLSRFPEVFILRIVLCGVVCVCVWCCVVWFVIV